MMIPTDALLAHDTDRPADYAHRRPRRPDPLATVLATVGRFGSVWETAIEIEERATADGVDAGTVGEIAWSLAERVRVTADALTRAGHVWFHGDRVDGDTDPVAPAPDPYERVKSRTRPTRTRKGRTTSIVDRHGRSYVTGSHYGTPSADCAMSTDRLAHAIATAPRTATGAVDGIALSRLTAVAYPDLPTLTGADTIAWEESQSADPVRAGQYRPVRFPTRYRLATVRPRNGESARRVTFHDGQSVTGLLSPATQRVTMEPDPVTGHPVPTVDPVEYVWQGHTLTRRPVTVRAQRVARVKRVDRAVRVPSTAVLADALAGEIATVPTVPYRVTWTHTVDGVTWTGAITVTGSTDRPRYGVTGLPSPVRNYATADGVRTAIDRATDGTR